jgi:hypothetical protein
MFAQSIAGARTPLPERVIVVVLNKRSSMPVMKFEDVIAQRAHIDDLDAIERSKTEPALAMALRVFRPPNWWGAGVPGDSLLRIAIKDGIPLAWVPTTRLVREIGELSTREERIGRLLANAEEVVDQCDEMIAECVDPWLASTQPLAASTVRAWKAGEGMAAMALAVNLAEDLAFDISEGSRGFRSENDEISWNEEQKKIGSKYAKAVYRSNPLNPYVYSAFLDDVVRAPIPHFFVPWGKSLGAAVPSRLSRHVAVHRPTTTHYTRENSLLAIMLVASFLREMQKKEETARADEDYDTE